MLVHFLQCSVAFAPYQEWVKREASEKKRHQSEIKTREDDKKKQAAELAKLKKNFDVEKTMLGLGLQACTASFP